MTHYQFKKNILEPTPLIDLLVAELPNLSLELSKRKLKILIESGYVTVNEEQRGYPKEMLQGLKTFSIGLPPQWTLSTDSLYHLRDSDILFENDLLIVVNKPAGLPTQSTYDPKRDHLYQAVMRYAQNTSRSRNPYIGLHHRLDRDTSGAVLFTKKKSANKLVSDWFQKRKVKKVYHAITWKSQLNPATRWTVENHLARKKTPNGSLRIQSVHSGGQISKTLFKLLEQSDHYQWVEAKPITGRTHQIRVHLAEAGQPIVGDSFYWPSSVQARWPSFVQRTLLHSRQLAFPSLDGEGMTFVEAPLPSDFLRALGHYKLNKDLER